MLSSIKAYALAALGVIAAIFAALFYREKANHKEAVLEGVEEAREIEHDALDQLAEDLKREAIEREKANTNTKRDDFS